MRVLDRSGPAPLSLVARPAGMARRQATPPPRL